VVQDLVDQVVDAAAVGRADVHARTLADGVETLEVGQVVGAVQDRGLGGHGVDLPRWRRTQDAASLPAWSDIPGEPSRARGRNPRTIPTKALAEHQGALRVQGAVE